MSVPLADADGITEAKLAAVAYSAVLFCCAVQPGASD